MKGLLPIVFIFFIFAATGEAYGVCWALWGNDTFQWNGLWIGLSLGTFGVCQTLGAGLPAGSGGETARRTQRHSDRHRRRLHRPGRHRLRRRRAGSSSPSCRSLPRRHRRRRRCSRWRPGRSSENLQGQFQGVLASAVSLASIVAPLVFSSFYFVVREQWPGAIWLSVVVVYAISVPLVLSLRWTKAEPAVA